MSRARKGASKSANRNAKKDDPFIIFGQPDFSKEEVEAVAETIRSRWVGTGPKTKLFEEAFAKYQGVDNALATSSCSAALLVALKAYGIGNGDKVITTAMTFGATVNAIVECGATPVLVDIEEKFGTLDLNHVEQAITKKTKAIIPVHLCGAPADIDGLLAIKERTGIKIIHDCAHAVETMWKGERLGAIADAACYSFYSTKNITTFDGGMLCSNDSGMMELARTIVSQGMSKDAYKRFSSSGYAHYDVLAQGFKFNMTDVEAAVGLIQLREIENKHKRRSQIWSQYQQAFLKTSLGLPNPLHDTDKHGYHLYRLAVGDGVDGRARDAFLEGLKKLGIGCGVHYRAIPQLSYYHQRFGWNESQFSRAVRMGNSTLSIPLTPYLSKNDVERVKAAVVQVAQDADQRLPYVAKPFFVGSPIKRPRRGILLSGGLGTRLYPATAVTNKHLLPVFDKPLIYYSLSTLIQTGVREIAIISSPASLPEYRALLGNGKELGLDIEYLAQKNPKGIAEAFVIAKSFIGKSSVALILGDNVFHGANLAERLKVAASKQDPARIFAVAVKDPERYGVVTLGDNGKPIRLDEKPKSPSSNLAVTGLYFYDNSVVELASRLDPSARGELEITDLNNCYLKQGTLEVEVLGSDTWWIDAGTPESLLLASEYVHGLEKGSYFGCPEVEALRNGLITANQFAKLAGRMKDSPYGKALLKFFETHWPKAA